MKNIAELEKQMFQLAKDLEFEQAASLRDEVELLRQKLVDISWVWLIVPNREDI